MILVKIVTLWSFLFTFRRFIACRLVYFNVFSLVNMNPALATLFESFEEKINRQGFNEVGEGQCHIFLGKERARDGYCYVSYSFNHVKSSCTVGKAQYSVNFRLSPYDFPQGFHVSHLCHNKKCIKIQHLSLEPAGINLSRKACVSGGRCLGHGDYPLCLLNYRFVYINI